MNRCFILGGGISGLTAASILSSKGFQVNLIESSPKLGGRTYSFFDSRNNSIIDNGQHILMGCYRYTLNFLDLIGAAKNFKRQNNLKITFIDRNRQLYSLESSGLFYPFNLLAALSNYDYLSFSDKLNFISFFIKLKFLDKSSLNGLSVIDWLLKEKQSEKSIKGFWEILCVGALNTSVNKASALIFYEVLREIFLKDKISSTIILPAKGLTESYINSSQEFIEKNGGVIRTSESVNGFNIDESNITGIITNQNEYSDFDVVLSTVPLFALEKIISPDKLGLTLSLEYSTILNIHIWLKDNNFAEEFYGLIDSEIHWIFNKGNHINLVISDADKISSMENIEILKLVLQELETFTGIDKNQIVSSKIIKEKRATFIPEKNILKNRPGAKTPFKNFFLAGDWINTGLPSTIESAVKSATMACDEILKMK